MLDSALSPRRRAAALESLTAETLDVLVIGGGVVGGGCALDAASRGLRVGLVEGADVASGTSSRSSKLIHGGLRYLEMLDFALVAEALGERQRLLTDIAPHLVRPVTFLYPLRGKGWERLYVGAGLQLYDGLARWRGGASAHLPRHRHLSRREVGRVAGALKPGTYVGGIRYHDAQVDDARFTLFLARTAAAFGAHVVTRCRADGLVREGGRVVGARLRDLEDGSSVVVRARQVINATGVWADELGRDAPSAPTVKVRASKGTHIVVPRDRIDADGGIIARTPSSVLLVIPWGSDRWLIGTTDTDLPHGEALDAPLPTEAEINYLLDQIGALLTRPLARSDVIASFSGVRPLVSGTAQTSKLSREHVVTVDEPGLVSVRGGKFTTYRLMAKDAVDQAAAALMEATGAVHPSSCTDQIPLVGAEGLATLLLAASRGAFPGHGVSARWIDHLLSRYGSLARDVVRLTTDDRALGEPLQNAAGYLRAEVVYAVTEEGALHLDDVMLRRTRIGVEYPDNGISAATEVAALMAPLLGWDAREVSSEIDRYLRTTGVPA
ncbi:glycerol-3-phosphate dehydrogenase/oxidase [Nocardioides agariphilus]|jgi:glycerol-3-phosphate dehydrogenase|uniref:Glycerol-3-phosphate dehydrogenase/oxidase n=1 Tax=Nocardioides agariphilus TaxID=433664 RepID=A0A930VGG9_9ACTN|nr:glycerol-3-phosphate dehydrogenase/oxidase [Nocardioides agariphilus]